MRELRSKNRTWERESVQQLPLSRKLRCTKICGLVSEAGSIDAQQRRFHQIVLHFGGKGCQLNEEYCVSSSKRPPRDEGLSVPTRT
jgi:hypothetical protein